MTEEKSMSLEETNKLRISLGLKPLGDPNTQSGPRKLTREEEEVKNYQAQKAEEDKKHKDKELQERIQKSREKREANRRLAGKTLGDKGDSDDDDDDDDDVAKWVQKSRTSQTTKRKPRANKSDQASTTGATYDSQDLEGLRIGHDIDNILGQPGGEDQEHILTLRDRTIDELEAEGDELQDINIVEQEKIQENLKNRKQKPVYSGYDDEDEVFSSGMAGQKRSLLSQYDEVIDGKRQKTFTIGKSGTIDQGSSNDIDSSVLGYKLSGDIQKSIQPSLDYLAPIEENDYYTPEEAGSLFKSKKSKKKSKRGDKDKGKAKGKDKRRNGRTKLKDSGIEANDVKEKSDDDDKMDIEVARTLKRRDDNKETNFVDDDELQSLISISRQKARRNGTKSSNGAATALNPEQHVSQLLQKTKEKSRNENGTGISQADDDDDEQQGGGMVISDMTEFVQNLAVPEEEEEEEEDNIKDSMEQVENEAEHILSTNNESNVDAMSIDQEDQPNAKDADNGSSSKSIDAETTNKPPLEEEEEAPIYEEPLVNNSLGSTLSLLKKRGWLEKLSDEQIRRERIQKDLERRKLESKLLEAKLKSRTQQQQKKSKPDDISDDDRHHVRRGKRGKADPITAQELEEQRIREQERQDREYFRTQAERLKDYNPDVRLEYTDKTGRVLSTKEAFNEMCYKFHGIEPGKNKRDKIKARLERENKTKYLETGAAAAAVGEGLDEIYKRAGTSHIVLSDGSNGNSLFSGSMFKKK